MFVEMQHRLVRHWVDMTEANVRLATDMAFGAARESARAMERAGDTVRPRQPAIDFAWPWSAMSAMSAMPGMAMPGMSAMPGAAAFAPAAFGAAAQPFAAWQQAMGALAPWAAPRAMDAAWMWPMLAFWQPLLEKRDTAPATTPAVWSAPRTPATAAANAAGWPFAQAADMSEAVAAAYRSASGFAAAAVVVPFPARTPAEAPRLPWPFAMWESFLPRR